MAKLEDLTEPAHRSLAQSFIKPELLARLSKAELRLRVKAAKAILDRAVGLPQESHLALHQHARKILRAEPVVDYWEELGRRTQMALNAPAAVRLEYRALVDTYEAASEYPAGLLHAVEQVLLGKNVVDPELRTVAEAAIAHAKVAA